MKSNRIINKPHTVAQILQAFRYTLFITILLITPTIASGQNGKPDSRDNGSQRFTPLTRTQRFNMVGLERSQRFGIQQVGEAAAVATRLTPSRPAASPYEQAVHRGDQLVKQGDLTLAIEQYRKAIELQPKAANAFIGLGYAYITQGDYQQATEQLRLAISHAPDNTEAHLNLGVALYNSGDIDGAITEYQQAIATEKNPFPLAHYNLGIAYGHNGDFDSAITHYREAIQLRKNNYPEAHNNLGLIFEVQASEKAIKALNNSKPLDEAEAEFKLASSEFHQAVDQQHGNYPLAHYNLARFHINKTEYDLAIAALQQAIKYDNKFAEAYLELGNCYLVRGSLKNTNEFGLAAQYFRKAIELRNNFYPLAHENLAIVLTRMGDKQAALSEYRIAVEQFGGQCPPTIYNLIATLSDKKSFLIYNELGRSDNPGNLKNRQKRADNDANDTSLEDRFGKGLREQLLEMLALYEELEDDQLAHKDSSYCAGLAYTAVGDLRAAIDEFSRALTLSKNQDEDAKHALITVMQLAIF